MPVIVPAAIAGGTSLYNIIAGGSTKKNAERDAQRNVQPTYDIPQSEWDNMAISKQQAGQGLSDASLQAYLTNAQRGLSSGTNAILKGGGDANGIANLYDKYENNIGKMSLADDQLRMQHLQNLLSQNSRMSDFADKQWQLNQYAPWANKAQLNAQRMQQSNAQIGQGITGLANTAMGALNSYLSQPDSPQVAKTPFQQQATNTGIPQSAYANTIYGQPMDGGINAMSGVPTGQQLPFNNYPQWMNMTPGQQLGMSQMWGQASGY